MIEKGVIVIAGASRGIGKWLADDLSTAGYSVIGLGRSEVSDVESEQWEYKKCDTTKLIEVESIFNELRKQKKSVYACIYAAGIQKLLPDLLISEQIIKEIFEVNTFGCFSVFQVAAKSMMRSMNGRLITLGSIHQYIAASGAGVYAASKAANERFGASLARELAPLGITVNTVAISLVEGLTMASELSDEAKQKILDATLIGRQIKREEIAGAVSFLLSDAADAVTAQTIVLGGLPSV